MNVRIVPWIMIDHRFFQRWAKKMSPQAWVVYCGLKMYADVPEPEEPWSLESFSEDCGLFPAVVEDAIEELQDIQLLRLHDNRITLREPGEDEL